MKSWIAFLSVGILALASTPHPAVAGQMTFTVLENSRATFKSEALLETVVGTTSGPAVSGTVTGDLAKPQAATGVIRVDLATLRTGHAMRDADMLGKDYLDTKKETNRYAVFELKGVEMAGPLQPGNGVPAKLRGTLTIKGVPVNLAADAHVSYLKLTPEQLETQRNFGFTSDTVRVSAKFNTSFTNHRMQIPQVMFSRLSNDIQLDVDLTLVRK
jgi:polyisoprenoid-binding protein YceI